MELSESIAWITLGFLPMLGSMELAWRLGKKTLKPKYKTIGETRLIEV